MNNDKILEMINLYLDGELDKSKEVALFSLLASDQSARDYFKQFSRTCMVCAKKKCVIVNKEEF